MARPQSYSYSDAGFNGFLRRTINSNPNALTLREVGSVKRNTINFDQMLVSGAVGDKLRIGKYLVLNGSAGRLESYDEQGNEVGRVGNVED